MTTHYIVRELDRDGRSYEFYGPFTTIASAERFVERLELRYGHRCVITALVPSMQVLGART